MELRHIRYFLAVAEERNFTKAAARLGIGQPPVSQQIRDLEDELGAVLFHRVPHGAELTEAGMAFLEEARGILAGAERAKIAAQRASHGQVGKLSIGLTGSAAFNPVVIGTIRAFRLRWPGVLLTLDEMNTMRLLEQLAREAFDAIFVRPGVGDLEGIHLHRLPDEPMIVALPARHPLTRARSLPLDALAKEPFILYPPAVGLSLYHEVVVACQACGFEPIAGQIAPQIASGLSLVAAGLGVSVVPGSIMRVRVPGVVYRQIKGTRPIARLALASRWGRESPALKNFIQTLGTSSSKTSLP